MTHWCERAAGLMSDEIQPWYVSAWNFYIPTRISYGPDATGLFSHPKVRLWDDHSKNQSDHQHLSQLQSHMVA